MSNHYDVIVIGSGPGGASLAQRLAPTGKRILLLERGDYLPRTRANWDSSDCLCRRRLSGQGDMVRKGWRGFSSRSALLCRRQFQGLRRSPIPDAANAILARYATRMASRRPGRCPMMFSSHIMPRPSACFMSMASAARIRPNRPPAAPFRFPLSATNRASRS